MQPLLLGNYGVHLNTEGRNLIIRDKIAGTTTRLIPHETTVTDIVVPGYYGSISFSAIKWLMANRISLITLGFKNEILSVTMPKEPAAAKLKIAQYSAYLDTKKRRYIAEIIVKEKIKQSLNLLNELSKYYTEVVPDNFRERTIHESILIFEGNSAIEYWREIARITNKLYPDFHFVGRNSRKHSWNMNASTEISALLNYSYGILESQIRKAVNMVGLSVDISCVHDLKPGRQSLIFDLIELFRWMADLSVIQLLEDKKIKKSDFLVSDTFHLKLKSTAANALIEKIKLNFNRATDYKGRQHSYEYILNDNVRIFANYLLGTTDKLVFNIPEIELNRNDETKLRERILNMTPEERRELHIARNTLHYMKKNIAVGKKVKIYEKVMSKIGRGT